MFDYWLMIGGEFGNVIDDGKIYWLCEEYELEVVYVVGVFNWCV